MLRLQCNVVVALTIRVWDTVRALFKTSSGSLGAVQKKPIARDGLQIAEKKIVMQPAERACAGHASASVRRDSIHHTSRVSQRSKGRVPLRSARGRRAKCDFKQPKYMTAFKSYTQNVQTALFTAGPSETIVLNKTSRTRLLEIR